MDKYEVKLKRKGKPVIELTIEGEKMITENGIIFFDPSRTWSVIAAIIGVMQKEGLEWIRVDEK